METEHKTNTGATGAMKPEAEVERTTIRLTNDEISDAIERALRDPVAPNGPFGHYTEINGPEAIEQDGFRPTIHELKQLAEYWIGIASDIQLWWFYYADTGSYEIRWEPYAYYRLDRIADVIGEEAVREIVENAWNEHRKRMGEDDWRIFTSGTPEEHDAVLSRVNDELEKRDSERAKSEEGA